MPFDTDRIQTWGLMALRQTLILRPITSNPIPAICQHTPRFLRHFSTMSQALDVLLLDHLRVPLILIPTQLTPAVKAMVLGLLRLVGLVWPHSILYKELILIGGNPSMIRSFAFVVSELVHAQGPFDLHFLINDFSRLKVGQEFILSERSVSGQGTITSSVVKEPYPLAGHPCVYS
jgi:hypothetical protein